jgi:F-type H+-transporting ATPase subunit b
MISIDIAFVIQTVNFLLLMFILNIFLYKPVRKILADRESEIAASKEKTAAVDMEVREKMALYEAKLRAVKAKANEEKNMLIKEARDEESGIIEKARFESANALIVIQNRVADEAESAKSYLKEQAQALSLEICEKVLGRSL